LLARTRIEAYRLRFPKLRIQKHVHSRSFLDKPAIQITFQGPYHHHRNILLRKVFVRTHQTLLEFTWFASPPTMATFLRQSKSLIRTFQWLDPLKQVGVSRLPHRLSSQQVIQHNLKSVVSISVGIKKGKRTIFRPCGSGFVVDPRGYVLTNHHVVFNRYRGEFFKQFSINWDRSTDRKSMRARLIGAFQQSPMQRKTQKLEKSTGRLKTMQRQHIDIALLKLEGPGPFPLVKMSSVRHTMWGDTVVAMGFPLEGQANAGMGNEDITATSGALSRLIRLTTGSVNQIQHTSKIAGGNSGGPLFDLHTGAVIGINTWVGIFDRRARRPGMSLGYFFALPIDLAWQFFPDHLLRSKRPMRAHHWYERGLFWLSQQRYSPAKRAFMRARKLDPKHVFSDFGLSQLFFEKAKRFQNQRADVFLKHARRWADRGLSKAPNHPLLLQQLARITIAQSDYSTSSYLIAQMLKREKQSWYAHYLKAKWYLARQQVKKALDSAQRAHLLSKQKLPFGTLLRGEIFYSVKHYYEGIQAFRQAQRIDRQNQQAQIYESVGYIFLNQPEEAIRHLNKLVEIFPYNSEIHRFRILAHARAKHYKKGLQVFFEDYYKNTLSQGLQRDPIALYFAGLCALRGLPSKHKWTKLRILIGVWGELINTQTRNPFAQRAGRLLTKIMYNTGYKGIAYGILQLLEHNAPQSKHIKLQKAKSILSKQAISTKGWKLLLYAFPSPSPALIQRVFQHTPSTLSLRTRYLMYRRGIPANIVEKLRKIRLKRRLKSVRKKRNKAFLTMLRIRKRNRLLKLFTKRRPQKPKPQK
ncbi:MAG: trypsin-like peptidase domain-containing protein, partial [Myxococcota bacterium]